MDYKEKRIKLVESLKDKEVLIELKLQFMNKEGFFMILLRFVFNLITISNSRFSSKSF